MTSHAVVTGLGVVNAAGSTTEAFWRYLWAGGHDASTEVDLFGESSPLVRVAVVEEPIGHGFSARHRKRLDRLTLLAAAAAREAVTSAGLDPHPGRSNRVGVFVGNVTGGWSYVEPQLYELYRDADMSAVNPYVATAWFPTAVQGEVSIAMGLGGISKTFSAENLSFAFALRQAVDAVDAGGLDAAVVIGAEAPLTPLVHNACLRQGVLDPQGHYSPYRHGSLGAFLGEGAAALVVESAATAAARHAIPLVTIERPVLGQDREEVARSAAGNRAHEVTYVALEGRGLEEPDQKELFAMEGAFDGTLPALSTPTGTVGALLGASFATQTVAASLAVLHDAIPGGTRVSLSPAVGVEVQHGRQAEEQAVPAAMAIATDLQGQAGAILVRRAPGEGDLP